MNNLVTVKEAANLLGVSSKTIRRWENEGRITSIRTIGGHRRFSPTDLLSFKEADSLIVGYARVTQENQGEFLERQVQALRDYCSNQNYKYEIIEDYGNGANSERLRQFKNETHQPRGLTKKGSSGIV
jgi:excisionase family DNA binding protein